MADRAGGSRSAGRALAAIVAAMTAMGPSSAIAATGDDAVEVSPLRIEGDLPAPSVRELRSRLLDAMTNVGFELVDGDATRATRVLRTTVRVEQRDYALEVELVETDGERVLVRAEEHCDLCGLEEVADRLAGLAASIRSKLEADARARPLLDVATVPAGATIRVDGETVGTSPVEVALTPGAHVVTVHKEGFAPRRRRVELVRGVNESVVVQLSPVVAPTADTTRRRSPPPWVGWSMLGGGAALTITGVTLLALHGRPVRGKCTGSNVDMDGTCRFNHDTLVPGAVLGAVGAALLATGIAFVITRHRATKRAADVALVPLAGGLALRIGPRPHRTR